MSKKFVVYEHLFPNGKRYFGIASKRPDKRWENGYGYDRVRQPVVYNAIQKYGWNNIEHNILFSGLSFEEATAKEKELIAKYKTNCSRYGDDYGYNMTDGGEGAVGRIASENMKTANRNRLTGRTGKDCPNSEPVICDGVEYESLTQFRELNNFPKGNIVGWLNGTVGMAIEWYEKGLCYKRLGTGVTYPQKSPHSYLIEYAGEIYESQGALAKKLGVHPATITCWLNGVRCPPKEIIENGLCRVGEPKLTKFENKPRNTGKTKVIYDGVIFDSQRSLAKFLGVNSSTLNSWLKGKNKMPIEYKEKGLDYIE